MIVVLLTALMSMLRKRQELILENLALRHQLLVLNRSAKRPKLGPADRLLWVVLGRISASWKRALVIVQPETVIGWQRTAFRVFWRWRSRPRGGRPSIPPELITLIRRMWQANPVWGCIRIRDELAKLGIDVSESTIPKYCPKRRRSGQTWKTFLQSHVKDLDAVDFSWIATTATPDSITRRRQHYRIAIGRWPPSPLLARGGMIRNRVVCPL